MTATLHTAFVTHTREFAAVLGADPRLELVAEVDAHEGPVYLAGQDALFVTTQPRPRAGPVPFQNAIVRIQLDGTRFPVRPGAVSVLRADANLANGMTADAAGRLVVCEQGSRARPARVSRVDPSTGAAETLVDGVAGLPLNSPNDVVVRRSDGTVWFTDPAYGFLQGFRDEPAVGDYVYRFDPATGRLCVVADGFDKPNGLVFSPDERVLYVGDSGAIQEPDSYDGRRPHRIVAFDVGGRGPAAQRLMHERLFAVIIPGFPDGLAVDRAGRVYASAADGIQVFSAVGELIGEIRLPGAVNFTFGGRGGDVLLVTTDDAVWAVTLAARGVSR